jgi:hypothetical protein
LVWLLGGKDKVKSQTNTPMVIDKKFNHNAMSLDNERLREENKKLTLEKKSSHYRLTKIHLGLIPPK